MKNIPNLLLIAGTGRNTGKTTLACSIIKRFSANIQVVGLKISPHFHGGTKSLKAITANKNFNIYEETSLTSGKDSSLMLKAGAVKVYYIEVLDEHLKTAFREFLDILPSKTPIVCESPALINYVKPGVFFIVDNKNNTKKKKEIFQKKDISDKWIDTGKEDINQIIEDLKTENNNWLYPGF
jgi:hypothetical protein